MAILDFAAIQKANAEHAPTTKLHVKEWKGDVALRKMNAVTGMKLARRFEAFAKNDDGQIANDDDRVEFFVVLLANSIVDDNGSLIFQEEGRRAVLRDLPFATLSQLGTAAVKLNGLADDEADEPKKNSKPTTTPPVSRTNLPAN